MGASHLGDFLEAQLREQKVTQKALCERMGVDATLITRAKQGERREYSAATRSRMIAGISESPAIKLQLVRALLLDVRDSCAGINPADVDVTVRGVTPRRTAAKSVSDDPVVAEAISQILARVDVSPKVRQFVLAAARILGEN